MHIKTEVIYEHIAKGVEKRFDTSNYEIDRLLPKSKNKKLIGLMKEELGGKIMAKFVGLRPKKFSFLMDGESGEKKRKRNKEMFNKMKN